MTPPRGAKPTFQVPMSSNPYRKNPEKGQGRKARDKPDEAAAVNQRPPESNTQEAAENTGASNAVEDNGQGRGDHDDGSHSESDEESFLMTTTKTLPPVHYNNVGSRVAMYSMEKGPLRVMNPDPASPREEQSKQEHEELDHHRSLTCPDDSPGETLAPTGPADDLTWQDLPELSPENYPEFYRRMPANREANRDARTGRRYVMGNNPPWTSVPEYMAGNYRPTVPGNAYMPGTSGRATQGQEHLGGYHSQPVYDSGYMAEYYQAPPQCPPGPIDRRPPMPPPRGCPNPQQPAYRGLVPTNNLLVHEYMPAEFRRVIRTSSGELARPVQGHVGANNMAVAGFYRVSNGHYGRGYPPPAPAQRQYHNFHGWRVNGSENVAPPGTYTAHWNEFRRQRVRDWLSDLGN